MTTKGKASSIKKAARKKAPANASSTSPGGKKQKRTISPTKRWLLITENAHARAQKRGFIGGDPFEDLLEAEQEIDAKYDTDYEGVFTLTDATELTEQFKSVFASYGFDRLGLKSLLDMHRDGLEKLAASNRKLIDTTSELATKQTALLQDVASEAVNTLQSFAKGWMPTGGVAKQAELSTLAMENALSHLRALTNSVAEISTAPKKVAAPAEPKETPGRIGVHGAVVKAYEGKTLTELAEAPVAALKGVSEAEGKKLKAALGIATIRDMATNRLAEWARGIVLLADTEEVETKQEERLKKVEDKAYEVKSLKDIADAPLDELQSLNKRQAKLLREALRIHTVRDLANNRFFCVASGIVTLADT